MADNTMYHALGQGVAPGEDPSNPNIMGQPAPHTYPPPQSGSVYGTTPNQWPGYGPAQQANFAPGSDAAYHAGPQGELGVSGGNTMAGLMSQMGGLGLTADGSAARTHRKKQHRHAYHDIGTAPSPSLQPSGEGINTGGLQPPSQSLNPASHPGSRAVSPAPGMVPQPGVPGTAVGGSRQGRVDPEQIPSIPRSRDAPAAYYFSHVYPTMERHLPPPAGIPFVAYDQGNSSPKFARLTLNNIPSTAEFLSSTALPLGMILQPFARLDPCEQPVPVLDFGDAGPPRCRRCRTYINPFMTFKSGGNKFICNMCMFPNDVPPEYFAPLEPSGTRVDRLQRPELMMGTVEFLVPKEYWNKEPVGLQWLFLIDVSQEAVKKRFLQGVCKGILKALYGSEDETAETAEGEASARKLPEGSKIGIVTFDKEVHFYNLSVCFSSVRSSASSSFLTISQAQLDQAQMMVMTDLEEPFVPLSEGLFVDPYQSKYAAEKKFRYYYDNRIS